MSFTHSLMQNWNSNTGAVASATTTLTGDGEDDLDVAVPASATTFYARTLNRTALQSVCLLSDQTITIKTNHDGPISPPAAPALGSSAGGTLAATTYYVKTTYVDGVGETLPSTESSLAVALDNVLTVTSPPASLDATGYNVYVSTATGTETKQNASPINIATNWTEPTTGLTAGAALPGSNTTAGPQDTINLTAGVPVMWNNTMTVAAPISAAVTGMYVVNTQTVAANLKIRALLAL